MSPVEAQPDRTAVYGPVCTVVWEGRRREVSPYPDQDFYCEVSSAMLARRPPPQTPRRYRYLKNKCGRQRSVP